MTIQPQTSRRSEPFPVFLDKMLNVPDTELNWVTDKATWQLFIQKMFPYTNKIEPRSMFFKNGSIIHWISYD